MRFALLYDLIYNIILFEDTREYLSLGRANKAEENLPIFSYDKNDNFNILYCKRARTELFALPRNSEACIEFQWAERNKNNAVREFCPVWRTRSLNNFLHP